jgi:Fe-S-cluster-containing dehydrogenase component
MEPDSSPAARWLKVPDQTKCIGCHACTVACKSENEVPVGVTRTYVRSVDAGVFPQARLVFQVTRCNQCTDAPCVTACPTGAMFRREDGIVDFGKPVCIGCKACMAACPYDAIFINPEDRSAGNATCARTASTPAWSRPASPCAPVRRSLGNPGAGRKHSRRVARQDWRRL